MGTFNFIKKWSEYILNETLKTNNIDFTLRTINNDLSLLGFNFILEKLNNTILLQLNHFYSIQPINQTLDLLNSLFIDRNGYFPSKFKIINRTGNSNILQYDEDYLKEKQLYIQTIIITYEPKYDVEINLPNKLYHLSIQEYEHKILKNGIIPKGKNKLSKHLDRIYVCSDINYCYKLINMMNYTYLNKKNINTDWIIFEIDTTNLNIKLFKDPNYDGGFYVIDNISPLNIKIVDKEKG